MLHLSPQQLGPEALIAVIRHELGRPDFAQRRTSPVSPATSSIAPDHRDLPVRHGQRAMLDGIGGQLVDNHAHGQGRLRPELDLGAIQPQPACMPSVCGSSSVAISSAKPISPQRSRATRLCERPSALIRPRNARGEVGGRGRSCHGLLGDGADHGQQVAHAVVQLLHERSAAAARCGPGPRCRRRSTRTPLTVAIVRAVGQDAHQVVGGAVARVDPRSSDRVALRQHRSARPRPAAS